MSPVLFRPLVPAKSGGGNRAGWVSRDCPTPLAGPPVLIRIDALKSHD